MTTWADIFKAKRAGLALMTEREAHLKAIEYFGNLAGVKDCRKTRKANNATQRGSCIIGYTNTETGGFVIMAGGKTFEEAFETYDKEHPPADFEQGCDSIRLEPATCRPMTTREAHQKALQYIGKYAAVERIYPKFQTAGHPIGPYRIGQILTGTNIGAGEGIFFVMVHGDSYEEAFANFEQTEMPPEMLN